MDSPSLVSLPLPMATALLCAVIAGMVWRLDLGPRRANAYFTSFFILGAATSLMVALRFGYGVETLLPFQRMLPLFLSPLLYLGFVSLTVDEAGLFRRAILHLSVPIAVMAVLFVFGFDLGRLDMVISASYAIYAVAMFRLWRQGPDALTHAPVNVTGAVSKWLLRGIGFLVFILILDSAIAADFALTQGANASKLISYGTIPVVLLLLATLITLPMVFSPKRTAPPPSSAPDAEATDILMRLERLMAEHRLFLEPDITVQRLAKRLSVPARALSAAVNTGEGTNMSQYVNRFRLAHAARLLTETEDSVSQIATQSGFLSRSNFYREFLRVYGQTPVEHRSSETAQPDSARDL